MSLFEQASLIVTPNAFKAGKLYSIKGADLDVVRATTATRVNSAGLIESVANNVPRLDYTNGSCPSILVEPQRTNLATYSEEFDNAVWSKTLIAGDIISNSGISPSGLNNAQKYQENSDIAIRAIFQNSTVTAGVTYTLSVLAKNNGRILQISGTTSGFGTTRFANFDLNDGTIGTVGSGATAKIEQFKDGWFKCSLTVTATQTGVGGILIILSNDKFSGRLPSYTGNGTSGIFIWGAQLEAGSNATSYIPTEATAVTRNSDVISKTGISDLIGQTEGTVFCDVNLTDNNSSIAIRGIFDIDDGISSSNFLSLFRFSNGDGRVVLRKNNIDSAVYTFTLFEHSKIAITYTSDFLKIFVNGVLLFTDTSVDLPFFNRIILGMQSNQVTRMLNDRINLFLVNKNALTEQECINLTTL